MKPFLLAAFLLLLPGGAQSGEREAACRADISATRVEVERLQADDLSRRFAEQALHDAQLEMESGEVEECPDLVGQARWIAQTRPYQLRPGEAFGFPPQDDAH